MKINRLLMILTSVAVLSSCVEKPIGNGDEDIRFSVLGDSYSAFEGYVTPDTNDVWYCLPPDNYVDVTSVEEMWWHQVAVEKGWVLERNNSFSGSLVCNMDFAHYYGEHSFLHRMNNLGHPDVIFVFGGTNDVWDEAPLGDFIYEDWTEEQLCSFRPALAYLFEYLKSAYPQARVYFMLDKHLGESHNTHHEHCDAFKSSVHEIANHCGITCIDLVDIHKSWDHPNKDGQASIARQVIEALEMGY